MFKKLQNKFLLMNMISISTIFMISLGIIYSMIGSNLQKENKNKLEQASNISLNIMPDVMVTEKPIQEENQEGSIDYIQKVATDFSVPFNLIIDEKDELLKINSYLDMTEEEYEELVKMALNNPKSNSIKYKNRNWMYQTSNVAYYERTGEKETTQRKISFLDITEQVSSMQQLFFILVIIAIFMLVLIYCISLSFAKKAIKPIQEAWEKQKQFVENASHELKTPLASIKANVSVLLLNDKDTIQQQKKWIQYIQLETDKMLALTKRLLSLAQIENKPEKNQKNRFNLSEKLEDMIVLMEALSIEKQIEVKKQIEKNVILVEEEELVRQVLQVLLENAFQYTNDKGNITVTLERENKSVKLSVENTGQGRQKEDLEHIFERFYKADKARTNLDHSYGLGLSIANIAVEKMGGKLTVESIPNETTTFSVFFKG